MDYDITFLPYQGYVGSVIDDYDDSWECFDSFAEAADFIIGCYFHRIGG